MDEKRVTLAAMLRLIRAAGADRPGLRFLDVAYGPRAAELRAACMRLYWTGRKISKSSQEAQWGRFRACLLQLADIGPACVAEQDAQFQAAAANLLGWEGAPDDPADDIETANGKTPREMRDEDEGLFDDYRDDMPGESRYAYENLPSERDATGGL